MHKVENKIGGKGSQYLRYTRVDRDWHRPFVRMTQEGHDGSAARKNLGTSSWLDIIRLEPNFTVYSISVRAGGVGSSLSLT
ncbi:hypothetical protein SESBI_42260 [Sesbania bispinosa]|nr:hypothetical protein SESBI_42260 [Sesbania bispinosa]